MKTHQEFHDKSVELYVDYKKVKDQYEKDIYDLVKERFEEFQKLDSNIMNFLFDGSWEYDDEGGTSLYGHLEYLYKVGEDDYENYSYDEMADDMDEKVFEEFSAFLNYIYENFRDELGIDNESWSFK